MRRAHVAALVIIACALVALQAQADFAAVHGFSGRRGVTCLSCHAASPLDAAEVVIEGLPGSWAPNSSHALTVRVLGGPPAMPAPQPQGGFELEVSAGTLTVPAGMEGLLRRVSEQVMTYTPEGTLMRSWQVEWTSPALDAPPTTVDVWLAGVAANGNHMIATNTSDAGEHGDATAVGHWQLGAGPEAVQAWMDTALTPPTITMRVEMAQGERVMLEGRHTDPFATGVHWQVEDLDARRDTLAHFFIQVPDLGPGTHTMQVQSVAGERASPPVSVSIHVAGGWPKFEEDAPLGILVPLCALVVALWRRPCISSNS